MSGLRLTWMFVVLSGLLCANTAHAKIEAIQGKRYELRKVHGPHMILVSTLRDVDPAMKSEGLSAEQAADEIVYQLRRKGIPAYVFRQTEEMSDNGRFIARQQGIAILAGNFPTASHRNAQKVLKYIQNRFDPAFLNNRKAGAIIVRKANAKPFQRAFLIRNPLLSDEDVASGPVDPQLVKLNSRSGDVSLLKNKGQYSVKVATFSGKSVVQVAGRTTQKGLGLFDESDRSADEAWELAQALRQASRYGYPRDYDAWVFHDYRRSYVTVGSFTSPDDPRVKQLIEEFRGKLKTNPKTGVAEMSPELFSIPRNPVGQTLPEKLWFMDATPRAIRVPGR